MAEWINDDFCLVLARLNSPILIVQLLFLWICMKEDRSEDHSKGVDVRAEIISITRKIDTS